MIKIINPSRFSTRLSDYIQFGLSGMPWLGPSDVAQLYTLYDFTEKDLEGEACILFWLYAFY